MPYTTEMRYTTDLVTPYQLKLLDDIKENRPLVFARDLVYFVMRRKQRKWHPLFYKTYTIHEMSPLTHSVRRAVDLVLKKMDPVYTFNYYQLIAPCKNDKLAKFVVVAKSVFNRFKGLEKKSINVIFDLMVYVARLSVECEIRGVRDAPDLAVTLINIFLMPLEKEVFALLHQHALDIIDISKK